MEKNTKPNTHWLLAAFAAPAAHFSGCGWLAAGMATAVILPLSAIPKSWRGLPKLVALAEVLWLGIVAGSLLPESGKYWPSDSSLAVPLTILGLAAFTNAAAAPRVGAMLACFEPLLPHCQADRAFCLPVYRDGGSRGRYAYPQSRRLA